MTLTAATPQHAAAMALIHARAFPPGERWGPDAMALQLAMPGAYGWICFPLSRGERGQDAGGFVLARTAADEAEILTLAVDPLMQRRGAGGLLLRAAMEGARQHGAAAMFLEVAPSNAAALALYGAAGFVQVGRRPRYYPGGGDALVLRGPLIRGAAAEAACRLPGD